MTYRIAAESEIDEVANTIALAFRNDPVWEPALARPDGAIEHLPTFWRAFVVGAMRYSTVFVTDEGTDAIAAVALWLPPGGTEMSEEQESAHADLARAVLPAETFVAFTELGERFGASRPTDPHMYLSLLATHPDHRGKGIAQRLLAENLAEFDERGIPAYLESTNPANNHRYARAGFEPLGGFRAVLTDAWVTTMWRPVALATA